MFKPKYNGRAHMYILKLTLRNRENRENHCGMAASLRLNKGISDWNNTLVKSQDRKKVYARVLRN